MKTATMIGAGMLLAGLGGATTTASAQTSVLTGLEDFRIANVGEGLFGVTRRNALNSRFQVNGSNPNPSDRNFGLWATFDLELDGLFDAPISNLDSVRIDLFQAQPITGQDIDNVITGGTMNVYYTLEDADVLASANGFDWIDSDAEGLGDQFADRVLVGTIDLADGNFDAGFDLDLSVIGSSLVDEINAGGFARFVFTTPDQDFATSWGVGEPSTSTILGFDGPAPTVTFTVPTPGAAMVGLVGVAMLGRRRR
ncbi:MAG: MYXO-CTERM sorting domain-containing protein [Phycisphaeraceae bacterium]